MACVRLLAIRIVRIARNAIHIFKNVAGLAIQCRTDGGEGGKADGGNWGLWMSGMMVMIGIILLLIARIFDYGMGLQREVDGLL